MNKMINKEGENDEFNNQIICERKSLAFPLQFGRQDFFDIIPHKRCDLQLTITKVSNENLY